MSVSLPLMGGVAPVEPLFEVLPKATLPGDSFELLLQDPQISVSAEPSAPFETQRLVSSSMDASDEGQVQVERKAESESEAESEPEPVPVVSPQHWLAMMLSQQSLQVQARDSPPSTPLARGGPQALTQLETTLQVADQAADNEVVEGHENVHMGFLLGKLTDKQARTTLASSVSIQPAPVGAAMHMDAIFNVESVSVDARAPTVDALAEQVFDRQLKLAAPRARWGEQMLHALRETVEVQLQQRLQQATIRLDPPELGSLEIFITHESGRLSVHLSAAQSDVVRLLNATSERLRLDLLEQSSLPVSVQVSDSQGRQSRDQPRQSRRDATISAARAEEQPSTVTDRQRPSDVLVTV
ncbi:flagellar hook-length control protein FliK [Pseudomonas plecoglossicida]|uniref:Flagellar hook-length control protein FliK n=1 Tax=Pseudomonas plecoglossicida TaxID=70775 RepID=A0AAD0VV97_PSEDL|nr:flagellar hook-length control protein FliK [Pseudomonas plecoglossicida]AXM98879.1 flagellar hook-length control protein FliK [Pseudomonas plecoglossicida]EPB95248.1 flagellar hook-length control protein [Pseudomonas plecoglossicida NB2011]QLB55025.1 flagellar hook-length control protein FliK [Pseudomonas plecoglossicida]